MAEGVIGLVDREVAQSNADSQVNTDTKPRESKKEKLKRHKTGSSRFAEMRIPSTIKLDEGNEEIRSRSVPERIWLLEDARTMIPFYLDKGVEYTADDLDSETPEEEKKDLRMYWMEDVDKVFARNKELPDVLIVNLPSLDAVRRNEEALATILSQYLHHAANDQPFPTVIVSTSGFDLPERLKQEYRGFLFSSSDDEFNELLDFSNELVGLKRKAEDYTSKGLATKQAEQYDQSEDLRRWEHITASTEQSLVLWNEHVNRRMELYEDYWKNRKSIQGTEADKYEESLRPERPIKTIGDLGTGEGRVAIPLAMEGYNVMGVDISPEMLVRGRKRLKEEAAGLRGELNDPTLSYSVIEKLVKRGLLPQAAISDEAALAKRYRTVEGSFFELNGAFDQFVHQLYEQGLSIEQIYGFFNDSPWAHEGQEMPRTISEDFSMDMIDVNWHTWCEIGDPENQRIVLEQIYDLLTPGGELMIEIPDREAEPYKSLLRKYHQEHPETRYGTLRESFANDLGKKQEFSPRYFPSEAEIAILFKSMGLEIFPKHDIRSYIIEGTDPETGEKTPSVRELFITARKPKQ